jgi:hypothetical protein
LHNLCIEAGSIEADKPLSNMMSKKIPSDPVRFFTASDYCDHNSGTGNHNENETPLGGNTLEARVAALEKAIPELKERLVRVETKLDNVEVRLKSIEENMVTKTDLELFRGAITVQVQAAIAEVKTTSANMEKVAIALTWRFVQISTVLAGLSFTAGKFIN